ncbi:hypothetical protein [Streptomyces sp. ODS28]|uniref:hypothetical protein n=1 Tax=Streptomyces sp. ODS28 TaxID=3136688 RepID=UPI0031EC367C
MRRESGRTRGEDAPRTRDGHGGEPPPGTTAFIPHASPPGETRTGRRALLAASAAAGLGLLSACGTERADGSAGAEPKNPSGGSSPGGSASPSPSPSRTKKKPQLPRGGRALFPHYRLVGYCGLPGAEALGKLGTGDLEERAKEVEKKAREYAGKREPMPVFELLSTVTNSAPGPDGKYRSRTADDTVRRFHELARKHDGMLLLNIQPGRATMLDEVKALHDWLVHPDVGVALDPEWDMGPGEVPGNTYGSTSGSELNEVSRYLSKVVEENDLPEKPFVFHQVAVSVVPDQDKLRPTPGVAMIKSADGIGTPGMKRGTWRHLVKDLPKGVHTGFKLFYDEDTEGGSRLMDPDEVLKLKPEPEYVMYE